VPPRPADAATPAIASGPPVDVAARIKALWS
jgi:hypothetical protein